MSRSSTPKAPPAKRLAQMYVYPGESGWRVRRGDTGRASGVYRSQEEATAAARAALRRSGGELKVQARNGKVQETLTLGRDPMAKIAAVEGIRLSKDMERTLAELDRRGASGDERRRAIAARFGKKR